MNASYGFALDQIRDARHEPGVLCPTLLLAAEQVPRDPSISQVLVSDSKTIAHHARDHRLLASSQVIEPKFLDAFRLGR